MENYSFTSIFDPEQEMIEGWEPFANRVVEAANALNAVVASAHPMFACGAEVGALPSPMVEGLLDDIIEDLYASMMVLENPFAHLAGVLGHLAGLTYEDESNLDPSSMPKALCYQNLLFILHKVTGLFCERTGFTARKERMKDE